MKNVVANNISISPWTIESALLPIAIALFPIYVIPSGGIQVSHLAFLCLSVITILRYGFPKEKWLALLLCFTIYVFFVEFIYGYIFDDMSYVINSAFFLFNTILSASVYQIMLRRGAAPLKFGVLAAAAIAVFSVYGGGVNLHEVSGGRSTGTFNNPNQLGYFSVCLLSLSYLMSRHDVIRLPTLLFLLFASLYLAIASLSKAAIIANVLVLVFVLQSRSAYQGVWLRAGLVVVVVGVFGYLLTTGHLDNFAAFNRVVNWRSENDSSLESRGYFAFLDRSLLQLIPGLGSFDVNRIVGHEVHSTFASIVNSYGLIGFSIYISFFVIWAKKLFRSYGLLGTIALQGPVVLYGISHNGNRFSIFWLLFSASIALATREHSIRNNRISTRHTYGAPPMVNPSVPAGQRYPFARSPR